MSVFLIEINYRHKW